MDLFEKYLHYLRKEVKTEDIASVTARAGAPKNSLSIGIVGAGISGLYSALLLQHYIPNARVKLFEANDRVGGRIFTYKFSDEPFQYCEAGAMRIPCLPCQGPVFQLIEHLNKMAPDSPLKLIDFIKSCPSGNRILVNATKMKDGRVMNSEYANSHCSELGFSSKAGIGDSDEAEKLIISALDKVLLDLNDNFEDAMIKYKHMSLHQYLVEEAGWTEERINYYEVMCWMTNISHSGLIDLLLNFLIRFHGNSTWKTIEGGMSALPELCAKVVCHQGGTVLLNAKVESMAHINGESSTVRLGFKDSSKISSNISSELTYENFDAVIMATPTSCIRMMKERPCWPDDMEHALRSLRHSPIIRILLRLKSRFWESSNLQHGPSLGGMSITDMPSRWFIYPSYGIGDNGRGILMAYIHTDDTMHWLSLTKTEKIQLFLRDLQALYPEVDVPNEYAGGTDSNSEEFLKEAYILDWTSQWSMGSASAYFPAQFSYFYPIMAQNRGNIYFAGDHLSINPVFIAGALESTKFAVQQLAWRQVSQELLIEHLC